jgi:hypothetical protein
MKKVQFTDLSLAQLNKEDETFEKMRNLVNAEMQFADLSLAKIDDKTLADHITNINNNPLPSVPKTSWDLLFGISNGIETE